MIASTLLRTAVVEYHEAFEYSKISNLIEYQDGFFFVSQSVKSPFASASRSRSLT